MSIDNRAPQVITSQLMDWLKTTYAVPSGPSYPQSPNDKDFFFNETLQIYAQYDQGIPGWVNLGPGAGFEKGNLPTGTNPIELYDTKSTGYAYLFLIYDPDEPAAPLLMTDQGFVVKKDIAVGGNVLSGQGAFILGYGWTGSGSPTAYSPPLIELMNSTTQIQGGESFPTGMNNQPGALFNRTDQEILYIWSGSTWVPSEKSFSGYYDTLFLVKNDGYSPANLHLDNLTADGQLQLQAGGDEYGIVIGGDANLYRSATGRLKTDGIFEAECGALLRAICIGSALYGMIPYPEETIQLDSGDDLRFCFGTSERMLLTNTGRLELSAQGSSGGLRIGDVSLYRDSEYTLRLQNNLIVEQNMWCNNLAVNNVGIQENDGQPYISFLNTSNNTHRYIYNWTNRMAFTFPDADCNGVTIESSIGTTELQLTRNGTIVFGGDTNLYRSAANVLRTQDDLWVTNSTRDGGLKLQVQYDGGNGDNSRLFFVENPNSYGFSIIYAGGPNPTLGGTSFTLDQNYLHFIRHDNSATGSTVMSLSRTDGIVRIPTSGSSGGLQIGGDVNLYRSAQDVLKTDDSFVCSNIAGNDAIFNSVKGTYSGAAVKAGDYVTLSWDGTYSNITAHNRHLMLNTDAGKGVYVYRDLLVNGKIYINSDPNILTSDDDMLFYKASGAGSYWFRRGTPGSYLDLFRLDNSGTAYFAGDVYVGGRRLYNDSGYLRCNSHVICDAALFVGTWANTTYAGPLYRNSSGQIGYNMSTLRHKKNIENVEDASWIYDLRVVEFDWNDEKRQSEEGRQFGLIAEEVNEICPKLVWKDKDALPEGVHYEWLGIPLLVEIKKLHQRVETLENQLKQNPTAA